MTNKEMLEILDRFSPIDDPDEEQALLDESFEEEYQRFIDGDDFEDEDEEE